MWVESVGLGKSLGVVSVELWSDLILGLGWGVDSCISVRARTLGRRVG